MAFKSNLAKKNDVDDNGTSGISADIRDACIPKLLKSWSSILEA